MTLVEKISAAWKEIDSAVIFKNAVIMTLQKYGKGMSMDLL